MPGLISHLLVGSVLFAIGRVAFRTYFKDNQKLKKTLLLAAVCLTFSLLPDFFLGIYYTTHLEPFNVLLPYQVFTHFILTPIAVGVLFLLAFLFDTKRRPIWFMGTVALVLHVVMDLLIKETTYLW
jgi:putative effector of murein hydrolase